MRILLLEDDWSYRACLAEALQARDLDVSLAADGREAIAGTRLRDCDLLISDVNLPGLSGLEVARRFRNLHPDRPVILMSADVTAEVIREADTLSVRHLLSKPFALTDFVELVLRTAPREEGAG